jgi:ribonuclease HI
MDWEINQEIASGSDHEILLYSIVGSNDLVQNPIFQMPYNLEKADWKAFSQKLLELDQSIEFTWENIESDRPNLDQPDQDLDYNLGLETEALKLQEMVKRAADSAIPRKRPVSQSKAWWSEKLSNLRKLFGKARKSWKRSPTLDTHKAFLESRNLYMQEIKIAKSSCWNSFLENAQGKEIFKAFAYTKQRSIQRLPVLKYSCPQTSQEKLAISFQDKCHAFMTTLFPKPPSSDPIDWTTVPEQAKWDQHWPEIKDKEVRKAIFTSSIQKAPGPDEISFLIIQKAYLNLESRFNRLYRILIRKGYHPRCWKIATGVILRKSVNPNRDFTKPKAYRVISLLNCLGKVSEKILARRLADLAELPDSDLLYYDQMGGRQKKSTIDSLLSLTHDIQVARHNRETTSALFIDIKGAFDHVSVNQLLKICIDLGLPTNLIKWIYSFLSDRKIKLAFDSETSQITSIDIGIPQGSPISPILFLIYIRSLFDFSKELGETRITLDLARYLSYMDDISILISSKSLEQNCRLLEIIYRHLIDKGLANHIQFDPEKTELIHFFPKKTIDLEDPRFMVTIGDKAFKAKDTIKWLGVFIDSRLTFKHHVTQKTLEATRVFHQIERLSNTERGLSFQAMRQLYIACICSIADYGVPIWWAGQKGLLDKYQKLQNQALRKILGTFKTSPIRAMEVEASLPPPAIRLDKICRSYTMRTIDFNNQHAIKKRLPKTFFLNQGNFDIDTSRYLDWSTPAYQRNTPINLDPVDRRDREDPDYRSRNIRKHPTQLIRLLSMVAFRTWQGLVHSLGGPTLDLDDLIDITISDRSKEDQAIAHKNQVNKWVSATSTSRSTIDDKIIVYTDGSQSEKGDNGAGLFLTNSSFSAQESMAWNLGQECEVYDAELFAIYKALEIGNQKSMVSTLDLWIFSDSQAALKGLQAGQNRANQGLYRKIYQISETIKKESIDIHIVWVPGHMGVYGNERADEAAKYGANWVEPSTELGLSISFLSRKLKERILSSWSNIWAKATHSQHYQQFQTQPRLKASPIRLPKPTWSTIMQLKLAHGYFRSYLVRLPDYDDDSCPHCHGYYKQTPYHLLFKCQSHTGVRKKSIQKLDKRDQNLYNLFMTTEGQKKMAEFLQESKIATRQWILQAA